MIKLITIMKLQPSQNRTKMSGTEMQQNSELCIYTEAMVGQLGTIQELHKPNAYFGLLGGGGSKPKYYCLWMKCKSWRSVHVS